MNDRMDVSERDRARTALACVEAAQLRGEVPAWVVRDLRPLLEVPEPSPTRGAVDPERVAQVLAEHVTAIFTRRADEPVDVCRFHRELADAVVAVLPPSLTVSVVGDRPGWELMVAVIDELRRSNDDPDPERLWKAVLAFQEVVTAEPDQARWSIHTRRL